MYVCMYAYMHTCTYTCIHSVLDAYMYVGFSLLRSVHACWLIHIYAYIHNSSCTCIGLRRIYACKLFSVCVYIVKLICVVLSLRMSAIYVCIFIRKYVGVYIHVYMYVYILMYVYLHIYVYVYTHTYTNIQFLILRRNLIVANTTMYIRKYKRVRTQVQACVYANTNVCTQIKTCVPYAQFLEVHSLMEKKISAQIK